MSDRGIGNHPDIDVVEKKTAYDGYLQIDVYRLRHKKFDGGWTDLLPPREVCVRGQAVGVLLYDPDRDSVVLIEQFRVAAAAAGGPAWLTEIVAGLLDEGETPEDVARREAREEAGCTVQEIETICDYFPSPGAYDEHVTVFCGRVDSGGIGGIGGLEEEHEDIRISVVPADESIRLLDENRLNNSIAIIALGWFARHRERLRAQWRRV
ncbi:NUDIX domain-containing protein [Azospirillum rugosum]|uniref:ADP-ribose pyrophosphatase n=1 Tax=Azospirillum rugosum TaxID=416170 RepID=A0ABS4SQK2_9PROT|nr:NUDIX domain-containing protein [Azospirillum rugosum]MBP2294732.1 ADP-ribose pyrophosphatase [Azospirillum rugosum]MDQ0527979.1 ADP-ribose pyrophosphatase [Azospirillum rugosum]